MSSRPETQRRLGVHTTEHDAMLAAGGGKCWICQSPPSDHRSLAIDHDHLTGTVRGLLCTSCNIGLGFFRDNPTALRAAADYLEQARGTFADMCEECSTIHPPTSVLATDGEWTRFTYRCTNGHEWICGYSTRGVPWVWGYSG